MNEKFDTDTAERKTINMTPRMREQIAKERKAGIEAVQRLQRRDFQGELAQWANGNLPAGANHLKKLEQELAELKDAPSDPMEMADVGLALMLHAARNGVDLLGAMRKKFEIVKTRKYGPLDADGISQHVEVSNNRDEGPA